MSTNEREDAAQRSTTSWSLRQGWPANSMEAGAYEQGHLAGSAWAQDRSRTADKAERERDDYQHDARAAESALARVRTALGLPDDATTDDMEEAAEWARAHLAAQEPTDAEAIAYLAAFVEDLPPGAGDDWTPDTIDRVKRGLRAARRDEEKR